MTCLFCEIVAGRADGAIVLDEPDFVAFLDTRPVFKGHALLVPREHVDDLVALPDRLDGPLTATTKRLTHAVTEAFGAQGAFVATNVVVSQSVRHLHVHVVPRTKGDGLRGFFWPRTKYADDAELHDYARRLRAALESAA